MAIFTRKQQITLDAVRRVVAKNAPKYLPSLTPEVLAKIIYIYPKAYSIRLAAAKGNKAGEPLKHQYVLVPNLRDGKLLQFLNMYLSFQILARTIKSLLCHRLGGC
jgi:hypothetical protein